MLRTHYLPGAVLFAALVPEAVAEAGVPVTYYAATIGLLGFIFSVVKVVTWVNKTWDEKLEHAFKHHNELDQARWATLDEKLQSVHEKLDSRPCAIHCRKDRE